MLYNVDATENIDSVVHALIEYAIENGVKVTSTRLLKEYTFRYCSPHVISVNIDSRDFHINRIQFLLLAGWQYVSKVDIAFATGQ